LHLLEIKTRRNITDAALKEIVTTANGTSTSLHLLIKTLKNTVSLKPIWVDMCINSCCAYTGQYKDHVQCEYCEAPRFQDISDANKKHIPRHQMAYFSIKGRLIIQYQDPVHSKELRYRATVHNSDFNKIEDIYDGKRYQKLLSCGFFNDERDVALIESVEGYQIFR